MPRPGLQKRCRGRALLLENINNYMTVLRNLAQVCLKCVFQLLQTQNLQLPFSCRPGATEAHLAAAEQALGLPLPPALRVVYLVHDGQHLPGDAAADTTGACDLESPDMLRGLFGGCGPAAAAAAAAAAAPTPSPPAAAAATVKTATDRLDALHGRRRLAAWSWCAARIPDRVSARQCADCLWVIWVFGREPPGTVRPVNLRSGEMLSC